MDTVWTDKKDDRIAISFSKDEVDIIRQALDTEGTQLLHMAALYDIRFGDELDLTEKADLVESLKMRLDDIAKIMEDKEDFEIK